MQKKKPGRILRYLIKTLYERDKAEGKEKPGVVLLIDEYDTAISGNIDTPKIANNLKKCLQNWFRGFKSTRYKSRLFLMYITGASPVAATVNIFFISKDTFSGLNFVGK